MFQLGPNHNSSALTKLTTRLNFLKERRSQIANELQNMDRGRVSGQSIDGSEKGRGVEAQRSVQNSDDTKGSADNLQSIQDSDKRAGSQGNQPQKSDAR